MLERGGARRPHQRREFEGDWVLLPRSVALRTRLRRRGPDRSNPTTDARAKPALRVAIAHPNAFALPLLILQYLCEPHVKEEFDNDEDACTAEAAASLCLYLTAWHFVFWSYAYGTLEDAAKTAREEQSRSETAKLWCKRLFLQPNMIGMYAGVIIGATPLRRYYSGACTVTDPSAWPSRRSARPSSRSR